MRRIAICILSASVLVSGFRARAQAASAPEEEVVTMLDQVAATRAASMKRLFEPFVGTLGKRGAASFELSLNEAGCYEFLGVGGEGVQDLTLTVEVDGREVAADRISGMRPAVKWCAPTPVKAVLEVVMYGGAGAFALGVYASKGAGEAVEKAGGDESDFIANRLRLLYAQFGGERAAITPVVRGNLPEGGERAFEVVLRAGRCYTAIAVADPSVKDLDVVILTRTGEELSRDDTHSGFAVVSPSSCPKTTGTHVVKVRAVKGFGQFGAQLFSEK